MTLNLTIPQQIHSDFSPRITVIGVGGGGTNAVDNMIAANFQGVEFVVANTDAQQLIDSAPIGASSSGRISRRDWAQARSRRSAVPRRKKQRMKCTGTWMAATWCSSPQAWAAAPARAPRQ